MDKIQSELVTSEKQISLEKLIEYSKKGFYSMEVPTEK